jgi:multiple sugar transport system substrate-binding protein
MQRRRTLPALAATAAIAALTLSACGGSDGSDNSNASSDGNQGTSELTFWGWAPGYKTAVEKFNKSQDKIKVKYEEIAPGAKGGYEKMLNSVKAEQGVCLGQVGYETLPSFVGQGALEDLTEPASGSEDEFAPGPWNSVKVGDAVYGAPVDQGPMALFYNKKAFEKYGLGAPTTWEEYEAAGKTLKEKSGGKVSLTSPYVDYDMAGFSWQADAPWFGIDGDSWKVSMTSQANTDVADYWSGLVDQGLVSQAPMYDQAWYSGLSDGSIATVVGAVWQAGTIKDSAKEGSGDWAVAPMPQWDSNENKVGNVGGSATAVFKGCSDPGAAWEFAHWMSTDQDAFAGLVDEGALYPAATELLDLPALTKGDDYFGGQKIYDVFKEASADVSTDWTWGPNMTQTAKDVNDELGRAWTGKQSFANAFENTQDKTVKDLESQGLSVAK